ncbi:hypothetical protein PVAP13_2NG482503 [Panicum virgatum]|uniref:Uncharacterized protein n=1 Tax=Panicum virgatum TaxID=38727 RepID=A0A8T0VUV5_PANVG|nr:hypothetical protein PVAP13_2NG482503 [Panicum virgatum]
MLSIGAPISPPRYFDIVKRRKMEKRGRRTEKETPPSKLWLRPCPCHLRRPLAGGDVWAVLVCTHILRLSNVWDRSASLGREAGPLPRWSPGSSGPGASIPASCAGPRGIKLKATALQVTYLCFRSSTSGCYCP